MREELLTRCLSQTTYDVPLVRPTIKVDRYVSLVCRVDLGHHEHVCRVLRIHIHAFGEEILRVVAVKSLLLLVESHRLELLALLLLFSRLLHRFVHLLAPGVIDRWQAASSYELHVSIASLGTRGDCGTMGSSFVIHGVVTACGIRRGYSRAR